MLCILSSHTNIFFHLAAEEYLLKRRKEDFIMIWQSEKAVVVGKHQNAMAEINYSFIRENNIPVARRLSGGGTVFHGPGNLNFTFIMSAEKGRLVDFRKYLSPIIEFLDTLNIQAEYGTKNDLLINGLKISGNAEHVFKNRVLHHGTLLYDADLGLLNESILVNPGKYTDKAVQSNRSRVTNIKPFLKSDLSAHEFMNELFNYLLQQFEATRRYEFAEEDEIMINNLCKEKYTTWDWNFGYSPAFEMKKEFGFRNMQGTINLRVVKGRIEELEVRGSDQLQFLADRLKNCRYRYEDIKEVLKDLGHKESSPMLELLF